MKTVFRISCLTLILVAALYSPASAVYGTCYFMCFGGSQTLGSTYEECCVGGGAEFFPCPGGGKGSPYAFNDGINTQYCPF
jgi:hypothetical protein